LPYCEESELTYASKLDFFVPMQERTLANNQNERLKSQHTRSASIRPGSNARLTHNRLFPDRRAAVTSRTRTRAFSQHAGPGAIMDKSGRPRLVTF